MIAARSVAEMPMVWARVAMRSGVIFMVSSFDFGDVFDFAVVWDEEVAVHRGEHAGEQVRPDAQRKAERHKRSSSRGLAIKQYRRKEQTEREGPWRRRGHRAEAADDCLAV